MQIRIRSDSKTFFLMIRILLHIKSKNYMNEKMFILIQKKLKNYHFLFLHVISYVQVFHHFKPSFKNLFGVESAPPPWIFRIRIFIVSEKTSKKGRTQSHTITCLMFLWTHHFIKSCSLLLSAIILSQERCVVGLCSSECCSCLGNVWVVGEAGRTRCRSSWRISRCPCTQVQVID